MRPARLDLLQQMPVFGALHDDALRHLLLQAREVHVTRGAFFCHENDAASSMFVLESGRVSVQKDWWGRAVELHQLAAGDCFGEMALMDLGPRSASVQALEDCLAIEFGADHLMQLFTHNMEQFALLQMNLGREVCRRLREADDARFRLMMQVAPQALTPPGGAPTSNTSR